MPSYNYEDQEGNVLYRVVRYGRENKHYKQEHKNGDGWASGRGIDNTHPYRLPEVLKAIEDGKPVWIFEGEKDVETARLQGLVGTTNSGGAGKWNDQISEWLRAAEPVYIVWDRDLSGRRHALDVEQSLMRAGVHDIRFRRAAAGNDFTDHIEAGLTVDALVAKRPVAPKTEQSSSSSSDDEGEFLPAAFQLALSKLNKVTPEYGKENQYNALCPAHDDTSPSLSIRPGDDVAVMVHCHTNECSSDEIAKALGINPLDFTLMSSHHLTEQDKANDRAYVQMVASRHAKKRLMVEEARNITEFGLDASTGQDELAIPLEPIKWMADSWFRYGTSVILNAEAKTGKTRLVLNLMQSLIEQQPFLGRFATSWPDGARFWYGNYDMQSELFRSYLHDYNWACPSNFIVKHLGAGQFPFWIPEVFDDFVQYALRMHIHCAVFDTLHVAASGFVTNENDNAEMTAFISLLKDMCACAAIPNVLIVHHIGKNGDLSGRGASTLAGDVDGMWYLRAEDPEAFDSPRSLGGKGRELGVRPIELAYDLATESYRYEGVSEVEHRMIAKLEQYCRDVYGYFVANERWPRGTHVMRHLVTGDNTSRSVFMKEALGRAYTEHHKIVGRSYEVRVCAARVSELRLDA